MPSDLVTILPPASPQGDQSLWHFASALYEDYANAHDYHLIHASFEAGGIPFTIQFLPAQAH